MAYLLFLIFTILLFMSFLTLTRYEMRRGERYFKEVRKGLDRKAMHAVAIATHEDLPKVLQGALRALMARMAHDLAHGTLILVRFIERQLAGVVRALRSRHLSAPREGSGTASSFVTTIKDFKAELRNNNRPADEN